MLQAAVAQFNKGSLPRSAKMFEMAERLIAEKRIDARDASLERLHRMAEAALIARLDGLEQLLAKKEDPPFDEAELQSLLERAVTTLARLGTPAARRVVVEACPS